MRQMLTTYSRIILRPQSFLEIQASQALSLQESEATYNISTKGLSMEMLLKNPIIESRDYKNTYSIVSVCRRRDFRSIRCASC